MSGKEIYPHRKDLYKLQFWQCAPCDAYVGCHKKSNAKPFGRLANVKLRKLKLEAHQCFDPSWQSGIKTRQQAYAWLAEELDIPKKHCHIGMFDEQTCERVIDLMTYDPPSMRG